MATRQFKAFTRYWKNSKCLGCASCSHQAEDHPGIAPGRQVISWQTKLETCVPMCKYYSKPNPHTNMQGRQNSTSQKYVRLNQRPWAYNPPAKAPAPYHGSETHGHSRPKFLLRILFSTSLHSVICFSFQTQKEGSPHPGKHACNFTNCFRKIKLLSQACEAWQCYIQKPDSLIVKWQWRHLYNKAHQWEKNSLIKYRWWSPLPGSFLLKCVVS